MFSIIFFRRYVGQESSLPIRSKCLLTFLYWVLLKPRLLCVMLGIQGIFYCTCCLVLCIEKKVISIKLYKSKVNEKKNVQECVISLAIFAMSFSEFVASCSLSYLVSNMGGLKFIYFFFEFICMSV